MLCWHNIIKNTILLDFKNIWYNIVTSQYSNIVWYTTCLSNYTQNKVTILTIYTIFELLLL